MTRDRDTDIPEPDAPVTAAERARAEEFAELCDAFISGDRLPPAMDSDDRALLETATMIVAGTRELELAPERRQRLIEEALERGVLGGRRRSTTPPLAIREDAAPVVDLAERRAARLVPWTVAGLAAAAALALLFTRPDAQMDREPPAAPALLQAQRSRPSDALVGAIEPPETQLASERLDTLLADRMDGYRELRFRQQLRGDSP